MIRKSEDKMKKIISMFLLLGLVLGCSNHKIDENDKGKGVINSSSQQPLDKNSGTKYTDESEEDSDVNKSENTDHISSTKVQLILNQCVQENSYFCVPACLQMVLKYKNIEKSQSELAVELNTKQNTGTEYVDLVRVANKYLFNNENVGHNELGYHIQTLNRYDRNPQIAIDFERRVKTDISSDDPVFVAIDVNALYPNLNRGNHMIVVTGYALEKGSDEIAFYYYIDPSYVVQDSIYGGLKKVTKEELINAIVINEEPAYIY